jgi:hypothetical protein
MIGDSGYQGTGPITPAKKPPGDELTDTQKSYNYSINRLRAAVERARHSLIRPPRTCLRSIRAVISAASPGWRRGFLLQALVRPGAVWCRVYSART